MTRTPKNTAVVTVDEKGKPERELKTEISDPYTELYTADEKTPHSYVEMNISKGFDYGNVRVVSRVSLVCDQKGAVLDRAGVLAFEKAYAFACDGFEILMNEPKEPA